MRMNKAQIKINSNRKKISKWRKANRKSTTYVLTRSDMGMAIKNKLCATDILVLAIINTSDGNGDCFISDKKFSEMLNVGESAIRKSLAKLKKLGLIHSRKINNRRYLMATKFDKYRPDDILTDEELNQKLDMAENLKANNINDEIYDLCFDQEPNQKGVESNDNLSYS